MDLEDLTHADFIQCLEQTFRVSAESQPTVEMTLVEVTPRGSGPEAGGPRRRPFSLVFRGPPEPLLGQGIYSFQHESMATLAIFIVPLDQNGDGCSYEAIFN